MLNFLQQTKIENGEDIVAYITEVSRDVGRVVVEVDGYRIAFALIEGNLVLTSKAKIYSQVQGPDGSWVPEPTFQAAKRAAFAVLSNRAAKRNEQLALL